MHSELHIWFVFRFLVDYKHILLIIISDLILLYDISQINNIGDGPLAKPFVFVATRHFPLVGHYHGFTVYLKSHTADGLERLCDQFRVAKQIHCGLTVQKYDLPEVHIIVEILRLIEELCYAWLELLVQWRELESLVCNL